MKRRTGGVWRPARLDFQSGQRGDIEITEHGRTIIWGGTDVVPFPRMKTHCAPGRNLVIVAFSLRTATSYSVETGVGPLGTDEDVAIEGITIGDTEADYVEYQGVSGKIGRHVGIAYAFQDLTDAVQEQPINIALADETDVVAVAQVLRVRDADRFLPPHDSGIIDPTTLPIKEQFAATVDTGASLLGHSLVVTTLGCYRTAGVPGAITYTSSGKSAIQHGAGFITEGYATIRTNFLTTEQDSKTVTGTFYSSVAGTNHPQNIPPDGVAYMAFPFSRQ